MVTWSDQMGDKSPMIRLFDKVYKLGWSYPSPPPYGSCGSPSILGLCGPMAIEHPILPILHASTFYTPLSLDLSKTCFIAFHTWQLYTSIKAFAWKTKQTL